MSEHENLLQDYATKEPKSPYDNELTYDFPSLTAPEVEEMERGEGEGFGLGSLSRSVATGVAAGFTGFNLYDNADERDTSYEAIAYSIGHLFGLVGGVASLFTGVGTLGQVTSRGSALVGSKLLLKSATAKVTSTAVKSSLATTFGVNALKTGQAIRQFKSVPSWLTEVILKNKAKELRSVPQAIVGLGGRFGSKLGFSEQVAANITERSLHMGVLMGIAAEPLQNAFDPETYGTRIQATAEGLVFGGVMGTIGNAFDKTGLTKAGKFALGFQTEKFIADPAKRELANKSIRALSMGIFQTMSGSAFDDEAPTEMHVYNFLLGSYFGWHERSWVDTEAGKILARKKMGTTTTGALNLWKDLSTNSGDIAKADPMVKERVQEFVDSMIGKITKDGETIIASHPSLVTASAFKEVYGDFVNTAATLYEKGTLSKEQFDKVMLSKSLDEVYDADMKALNKSKEEYQQIVDANPEKLNEIIGKAKDQVNRLTNIRESIDYTRYINNGVDALLSQKQFQTIVDQAGIPKSILSPFYELATFLREGTSTASTDVLFGDYVKLLANNLKENVDLELINNNGKPLTKKQEVDLKLKTLEAVQKRILDEPSTKNPELVKKLTDAKVVDGVFSKLLNWANSTYTKQYTFNTNEQGSITGITEVGSIGADGKYVNHQQVESNFTKLTGIEIITVNSVSNDKARSVSNVSDHNLKYPNNSLSDSEIMKLADESGLIFIGGNKDKEDLNFIKPLIDPQNLTNAVDLATYLEKLDPIFKEKYPKLVSPTTYFNNQLAKLLKDIPKERQAYHTQLYINTYLNNIKLAQLKNGGIPYEEQVASGGKFLNNAAENNKRSQIFNAREVSFNPNKYIAINGVSFKENYIPTEITDEFLTVKINNDPPLKEGLEQKTKLALDEGKNKTDIESRREEEIISTTPEQLEKDLKLLLDKSLNELKESNTVGENFILGFHGGKTFDKPDRNKQYTGEFRNSDVRRIAESMGARYEGQMLFYTKDLSDIEFQHTYEDAIKGAAGYAIKYGDDTPSIHAYLIPKQNADFGDRGIGEVGVSYNDIENNQIRKIGSVDFTRTTQPSTSVESNLPGPDTKINIYAGARENAELSNFAIRPFKSIDPSLEEEINFKSVEQAFQYFKTQSTDPKSEKDVLELGNIQDAILKTTDGGKLRVLGKSIKNFDSKNWDNHSSRLMKELIKRSFEQNPEALKALLDTGNATLTHTQDKGKWGTEFSRLLMEVRNELRTTQPSTDTKVDNIAKVTADVKSKYYKELRETLLEQQKVDISTKENQAKDEQLHLDFNSELVSEESLLPQFNVILYDKFTITGISEITRIDENGKTVRDDRAIDGSIHFRSDVWNASAAERGAGDSDAMKGFVYGIGPEGALMVKPGFYKANGPEETIAISSGSHVVMHKSAVKQTGNRTLVDVEYNPETGEIAYYKAGTKETVTDPRFKLNIDAFTHNLGVGENLKELTNSAGGVPKQIGAGLSEEATNAVLNELFLPAIQGDLVENSRYSRIISTVKSLYKNADPATQIANEKLLLGEIESLDVSKLSPSNVINIFYGKDEVPFALYEKTARHILRLKESEDLGELGQLEQFISYQNTALKAIQSFGLSKAMLNSSFAKPFVDAKVRGYLIDSYVSPRVRNNASSKNIILPYDMSAQTIAHELLGRHLAVGEVLISEDLALAKKGTSGRTLRELLDLQKTIQQNTSKELDPLKNELTEALGIPKENLSDADKIMHENFISETTNKIKDIISKYEKEGGDLSEELSILSIRMPNITGSAVRALKVIGTNGRRGVGINYHPEDMLYMGGADVDFDTTMSFWQISKQLKDHYRARSKDFHEVDGRPKKKVELDLTPKDLDQLSYTHPLSILDPQAQLTAHKFAVTGKGMIGAIQNDQSIVGLLQQYMPSLKGNISPKVVAKLYLNKILTDSKGNEIGPNTASILESFIENGGVGINEAQVLTGLQLSGVSWERQFLKNPIEYQGAVATAVAATVDAASGTPIKPYKEVAQLLHEKIMGDPVIKLVSKSGKTVKIFNYNHKIDNPSREAGARISLFSNKAYSRLALLNDVISGKIKDEDKKTGKQFSRSIHPLEAIQLVKRTLAELKTMGVFPIDKVTEDLQINSVKYKALSEIDKMPNMDVASLVEVGGKSFQRMKENWDGIMRSLANAPKGSENEKLANEFLQFVMRYPQSAKVSGNPTNSMRVIAENEITLSDLMSITSYDQIVKDYEKVEVSDYAPGRGVAEESLQQSISYSHMRTQDLFDMASYIVVHEYAKKAFDNNISFDRLKELALASSEFKDGLSADENLRAQVKFKGKTKAPTRSESLDGLKQFRAELDASERDFFDAYLTSSLYPNLVRKNGEDIPVYQSLTEALKHDKIAPLSSEAQKIENAKLSRITAKLGVKPRKLSNVSEESKLAKKRFSYRTNMNKVALLLDNLDPAIPKRLGTIIKGLEDMSFEKDATPEMLKDIFPLFNKAEQTKTVNAALEFKESQKILPEIKEMEKQSLNSSEELAMRIMESVGYNPEQVQAEAKKELAYIQAKIKNKLSQKYNSIEELSTDVSRIMKENNITFTPAQEKLKAELVEIFTDHPSLFYEYNAMFSGITSSLPEKQGSYFSVEPGASPRFATLIDIQKFINVYKDIRLNKGKERSLRTRDFFRFMSSIGEDLDSFEQRKISFERGLVATPDGVYETPMTYLDSSVGSVAKMFDRVHSLHSIEEEVTRTYIANKVSFLNLLDPADATKLTSMAIRRLELGQGKLNPDLKAHYENKWKEIEPDYEQNFKGKIFKTKFEGGQDITGEQIVQKIQDVMVEFNTTFYTNFIRNDKKDNKYLKLDSDGFLDTNKTLEFILNENYNNRAVNLTYNGLSKLRHEITINKLQIKIPNGELVTLGSISDPVLKFWARNELNKVIPGGIDFSPIEFSTDHIQFYFPHNSFSKSTSNKVIKDALTEAVNKRYSSAYEEQQKINIKYRLAVANDPSIELVNNAFDQLSVEYVTVEDYIKLGMSSTPGHLKHRSRTEDTITEGYTEDLASYDKYITSIIKGKHNLLGVLMGNKIITDFQNKNGMGTHTSDWVKFMQLFIRDNVGLPTTFPTEWTGKGNTFISKFNPYWVFTDQAALNTISKINKMFSLKDNSIPHLVYSPEDINYIDSQTLSYSGRTASAIKLSDIGIAINSVNNTGGAKITKEETLAQNKKYIPVSFKTTIPEQEIDFIAKVVSKAARGGKVIINLSGNGIANLEARQGEADYTVFEFLTKLNTRLNKVHEVSISEVVTGGQSGIDEAATKAVIRVNANSQYNGKTSFQPIKNTVVHTNDFARTARNGNRYSDEAGFKQRFDLTKEIEKGFTDRQQQATSVQTRVREILGHRSLKAISMLEGKYQMLSLLAHPKYILGNLMGAQYNDIALAGLSPRLRANDKWLKEHVNPLRTGSDEWSEFAYKHGAIESMFSEEISQIKLQYGARGQKFIDGLSEMFKKEGNRVDIAKIQDLWSEFKIVGDINKFAANMIKGSERLARQKSWFTHYIKARDIFDAKGLELPEDHPWLVTMANRGVAASQFLYNNANRPAHMRTPMGTLFTRFQLYMYNSLRLRNRAIKDAKEFGFVASTEGTDRLQRIMIADAFAMSLATLLPMSIFTSTLPPPYDGLINMSKGFFGDDKYKQRPGYGVYSLNFPFNMGGVAMPVFMRAALPPLLWLSTGNSEHISDYYIKSLFPYGILSRDALKTIDNPTMILENSLRIPIHGIHYKLKKKNDSFKFKLSESYADYEAKYIKMNKKARADKKKEEKFKETGGYVDY